MFCSFISLPVVQTWWVMSEFQALSECFVQICKVLSKSKGLNLHFCLIIILGWVGLWGFLWWAPSAKRKDHHGVSSGWSSVWHSSNTGLSSTQYEQPWGLAILADSLLFSVNNILADLWLNCIFSVEITLFHLADILLQHRALFQC